MGIWGPGNFDSDTAADHLSILTERLVDEIAQAMSDPREIGPVEYWGVAVLCNIELLTLLAEQHWVGVLLPESETVAEWKAVYMGVWDGSIDQFDMKPGNKVRRRRVLEETFDRFLLIIRERESA